MITASQLYSHLICPHRVTMDAFGDPALRETPNAFVEMLWERGALFEQQVIRGTGAPFTDCSDLKGAEREAATREAMKRGDALIYGGRLSHGNLLGEPDLLRREATGTRGQAQYVAIDIKSGAGKEGRGSEDDESDGKPKKHYAVQLALYTDILIELQASAGSYAYIWDVHGKEVHYDFLEPLGRRGNESLWSLYQHARDSVIATLARQRETRAAASSNCKLCVWRSACLTTLQAEHDLSLLPELGRARRDALMDEFPTLEDLAAADVEQHMRGRKTSFGRVGPEMLRRFQARAQLAIDANPKPYLKQPIVLPRANTELFFDIETDPMRDLCYLHGFVLRKNRDESTERFHAFFAEGVTPLAERDAFAAAWAFLQSHGSATVYIYSKYERTLYRQLAAKYPDVCSIEAVDALFASPRVIDLYYDVVRPHSEWPTLDFSIKSIAKCLGFTWRDNNPSGAASIEWFEQYVQKQDPSVKSRILEYNEDDCRAMRVLVDAIPQLEVRES